MKRSCRGRAVLSLLLILALTTGCNPGKRDPSAEENHSTPPARKISVRVLVIDDQDLGPVIQRQFGSRQGGEVTLSEWSWTELADSDFAAVQENDILIYPAWRIGALASRGLLVPISEDNSRLDKESRRSLLFSDRDLATSWGDEQVAMSLGQSHWVMLCRSDILEATDRQPPESWKEFDRLAERLAELPAENGMPTRIGVPLQGHWASHSLMLRTASAIRLQGKYSSYFDVSSMEPYVDSEPFLRSLQAWQRQLGQPSGAPTPAEVIAEYASGKLAVAIVPVNSHWTAAVEVDALPDTVLAPVPGWESVYDQSREMWIEQRGPELLTVPLVGATGMLASASAGTQQQRNAIEVIAWLTSKPISSIISTESPHTGLSRKSHLGNPEKWLGPLISGENASRFADYMNELNSGRRNLNVLRIPHADRYLGILDDAVRAVVMENRNAVEQLATVARDWRNLTSQFGLDAQKTAYRRSEGLAK